MKAIITEKSGPPEVLQLKEVEKPMPANNEVLIKVHASTVTRGDVVLRKMHPLLFIPMGLLGLKRKIIPGHEFAGVIEDIGSDVTKFSIGDKVFGTTTGLRTGGNAEYLCLPEVWKTGVILKMPPDMDYQIAVSIPVGGMTALQILNRGNIQEGQDVLIYGASGSVGTYAVQLAKHYFNAEVTGVCSTSNIELVKSLGADKVIDYTKENITQNGQTYDVIFDAVGKTNLSDWKGSMKAGGTFLTVKTTTKEEKSDLQILKDLVGQGKLKPVIDRKYSLDEVAEAHKYVESGHKKGNVVILVGSSN